MTSTEAREIITHSLMFGEGALCRKLGSRWTVQFNGYGFPNVFRTKTAACERARQWVRSLRERYPQ